MGGFGSAIAQSHASMIELETAIDRILALVRCVGVERLRLAEAHGRYLSGTLISEVDLPAFDNSAMDGFAVRAGDVSQASRENPVLLKLIGRVAAGETPATPVSVGTCVRVFTGSPLPEGSDAVVMQEDTQSEGQAKGCVAVLDCVRPWENIRFRAEDVRLGGQVADAGDLVTPGKIALLAAVGFGEIMVGRQPVLGIIATGSELCLAGEPLSPGQIYESNRFALAALSQRCGVKPRVYPIVPDNLVAIKAALSIAIAECDVVVTAGGVSVGEFDFVKSAFAELGGELDFWRVAIKPGKPFAFGRCDGKLLFGLPGNPVSAFVTFLTLVRPALLRMQGARDVDLPVRHGILVEPLLNHGDRRHFVRVQIDSRGEVRSAGTQASHLLKSLSLANGLVDLAPGAALSTGGPVRVGVWD
ncbi:MAG: molybdopterin molybdenumtransferase MoeA [Pedosphaera sp.]|nr:molybdopterin molybdenumtransferase MoeA [Pedosphaera sp.]